MPGTLSVSEIDRSRLGTIYSFLRDEDAEMLSQAFAAFLREIDPLEVRRAAQTCVCDWRGRWADGDTDVETMQKDVLWHILAGLFRKIKNEPAGRASLIAQRFLGRKAVAKKAIQITVHGDDPNVWAEALATLIVGWMPVK